MPLDKRRQVATKVQNEHKKYDVRKRPVAKKAASFQAATKDKPKTDASDITKQLAMMKINVPRPALVPGKRYIAEKTNKESQQAPTRALAKTTTLCHSTAVPNVVKPSIKRLAATRCSASRTARVGVPDIVADVSKGLKSTTYHRKPSPLIVRRPSRLKVGSAVAGTRVGSERALPTTPERPDHYVDPDIGHLDDPQLCQEYAKDIYSYWLEVERKEVYLIDFTLPSCFVNARHRAVLIDWLFLVQHQFRLLIETMHLCVDILDRVLQVEPKLPKSSLQLVGITALFIASKYEEIYPPTLPEFVHITSNTYSKEQVLSKEVDILKKLDYQLNRPYSLTFLRRYSTVMSVTSTAHTLAKYILELSLLDHSCVRMLPSKRAAGALLLALCILKPHKSPIQLWDVQMAYNTKYQWKDIHENKVQLRMSLKEGHNSSELTAIRKRFMRSGLCNASTLGALNRL